MKDAAGARRLLLLIGAFCLLFALPATTAFALEKAVLQLKWLHHFQFAGYYAAVAKGYYRDAGLDVVIREGGPTADVEAEVASGRADFGVGTSAVLLHVARGNDFVVLGQIFQHSAAVLITPRKSGIRSVADLSGKRFMYSCQHGDMMTLLAQNGIRESDIIKVPHHGDPHDLVDGRADVMMAYSFNEPFLLEQVGEPYRIFSPLTHGIDFYGDNFFTTRAMVDERPQFVKAFRNATLRGWRYALANKREIADLILQKYSRGKSREWLLYEADQMEPLIQPTLVELGYQSPSRWDQIADSFASLGMLPDDFDPSRVIYDPEPHRGYGLLLGTLLFAFSVIAVLTVAVMKFRQLNAALRAEVVERKSAEEALRESEEQLRVMFDASQAGIVMVDSQGTIRFANRRMAELFGRPLDDVVGSPYSAHLAPDQHAAGSEMMRKLITGEIDRVETERHYLCGEAGEFWGYLSGRRLETPDGKLRALVGIIADISDRKTAEEARGKALMLVETILAQSPMGISVFDGASGECIRLNQAAADIAGGTVEAFLGRKFRESVSWREAGLAAVAEEVLADGIARPMEVSLRTTQGREVHARCHLSRFIVEGKPHLLVLGQDITEKKRLDAENRRIEAQMLNMQKLESLGVLAGGIAHDFNNILTGIVGNITFAQLALEPSHRAHGPLGKAETACRRAAELASQLLTFARGGEPVKKACSVPQLVRESVSLVLRGTNVKGELRLAKDLCVIEADEGQVNQALNNIIINAVHAMPGGGTLTITGENETLQAGNRLGLEPGSYVRLSFTDEGCGISEGDLKRIFDPYFTTKTNGTGLGLASTHSIVKKHGGVILVDSAIGVGSTFTLHLPSTGSASMPEEVRKEEGIAVPGGGSVLVMDDEEMIRDVACATISQLGYAAHSCADGDEAVELYRTALESGKPYSAVIMDLTVPGAMGGKEAAAQILSFDPAAHLVVSSGYSNDPVMAGYKSFGFCATLVKPYRVAEIAGVLGRVVGRAAGPDVPAQPEQK